MAQTESGCFPGWRRSHQKQLTSGKASCGGSDRLSAEFRSAIRSIWISSGVSSRSSNNSEDVAPGRDETVLADEPELCAAVVVWGGKKAPQFATQLLRGEGLLDHRVAALVRAVGLLRCRGVARHEKHPDVGVRRRSGLSLGGRLARRLPDRPGGCDPAFPGGCSAADGGHFGDGVRAHPRHRPRDIRG